jgi:hypothetical protein
MKHLGDDQRIQTPRILDSVVSEALSIEVAPRGEHRSRARTGGVQQRPVDIE